MIPISKIPLWSTKLILDIVWSSQLHLSSVKVYVLLTKRLGTKFDTRTRWLFLPFKDFQKMNCCKLCYWSLLLLFCQKSKKPQILSVRWHLLTSDLMNVLCSCGKSVSGRNSKLRWIEKLHLAVINVWVCVDLCTSSYGTLDLRSLGSVYCERTT